MRDESYVLRFSEIDAARTALVGGKGAHLAELSRIEGIRVPPGFCVTTRALARIVKVDEAIDRLTRVAADDRESIRALGESIRRAIEGASIPEDVAREILAALEELGGDAFAVRSSATAEDSPTASFAGLHDSYLNVAARDVLRHVAKCAASLFTDRALTYRLRSGFDPRKVDMAVVVQKMVAPRVAGLLFTADPVSGNRRVASIEATFGLGESLVSGHVNADVFKVRDGEVVSKTIARKDPSLREEEAVRLARLGRTIEARFGRPQDIEWCLVDDDFHFVQSRPITTLFPVPQQTDEENHVYISVGHQQMMTEAMTPLSLSFWQLTAARPMVEAGSRLFVDVTRALAAPKTRADLLEMVGKSDPLTGDALRTILDRGDFVRERPDEDPGPRIVRTPSPIDADPALVAELIARSEAALAKAKQEIATRSGIELLDFIVADVKELRALLFDPRGFQAILAATEATLWLNEKLEEWLGEKNAAATLSQSVSNNVTSEMGLALLDVADVIRRHPQVVAFLERGPDDGFLDALPEVAGGEEARDAIGAFLERYGMRCVGEIDITRPRFRERPTMLVPVLLGNVKNFEPGAAARRFEQGREQASRKARELLDRLRALPDGEQKANETAKMIDRLRTFAGYREYPKYTWMSRYFVYKEALLREAERLVDAQVLRKKEDVFLLRLEELRDVVHTRQVDEQLLRRREEELRWHRTLTPPRVLTSEGEVVHGTYRRDDLPPGALVGLPVSEGTIEGRARVILDVADADLEPGDILVTTFTDPSWTPLFVTAVGLVTEVGGLMTHGAVIAREYGLPAVVGVEHATRKIRDGQRIRVHGTEGYVEALDGDFGERDRDRS